MGIGASDGARLPAFWSCLRLLCQAAAVSAEGGAQCFLELAKRTDGDVTCVVDCEYVIKGFRRGPGAWPFYPYPWAWPFSASSQRGLWMYFTKVAHGEWAWPSLFRACPSR